MSRQGLRLKGVHFTNPASPVVNPLPIEKRIANLPGLRFWMDPQMTIFEPNGQGEGIRDRKARLDSSDYAALGYTLNAAIGGKPSLTVTRTPSQGLQFTSTGALAFAASGYTMFAVGKRMETGQSMIFTAANPVGGVSLLRFMVLGANNSPVLYHSNSVYAQSNFVLSDTNAHLYMFSWDAQTGTFAWEVDGVNSGVVGGTTTLAAPASLNLSTYFGIGTTGNVGANSNGSFGQVLHLDRPYHLPQYAAVKADITAALKSYYGI